MTRDSIPCSSKGTSASRCCDVGEEHGQQLSTGTWESPELQPICSLAQPRFPRAKPENLGWSTPPWILQNPQFDAPLPPHVLTPPQPALAQIAGRYSPVWRRCGDWVPFAHPVVHPGPQQPGGIGSLLLPASLHRDTANSDSILSQVGDMSPACWDGKGSSSTMSQ